jgi:hypothetical protein
LPRTETESNAINRVLRAWGLPSLDHPGVIAHFGGMVQDHQHFTELLKACEPALRRDMYEAMSPHLHFKAKPLDEYITAAKEHAEAAQLPTIEADGTLKAFAIPEIDVPEFELWVQCSKCEREGFFYGERRADAIFELRRSGWAFDESVMQKHICANCLGEDDALDAPAS